MCGFASRSAVLIAVICDSAAAFELRVAEQQLNGGEIVILAVNQRCPGSAQRVCAVRREGEPALLWGTVAR
jgi:hypothetical protein